MREDLARLTQHSSLEDVFCLLEKLQLVVCEVEVHSANLVRAWRRKVSRRRRSRSVPLSRSSFHSKELYYFLKWRVAVVSKYINNIEI